MTDSFTLRDCILFGRRFTGREAVQLRIVDEVVEGENVLPIALKYAKALAPKGESCETLKALKEETYREALLALRKGGSGFSKL